jgi:uroporphyrinogen-III synthase
MGVERLPAIVGGLLAGGRDPSTPVAVIAAGTLPEQQTLVATLADVVERAMDAGLRPPAVTVVGDVVRLRERLRWFDTRPLFGRRVLVTRTREQASTLVALLRAAGARPVELPTIAIQPPDSYAELDAALLALAAQPTAPAGLGPPPPTPSPPRGRGLRAERPGAEPAPPFPPREGGTLTGAEPALPFPEREGGLGGLGQWVIFTSANGVEAVFGRLEALELDARVFGSARIGAIGPATAEALRQHGLRADYAPAEALTSAVLADFQQRDLRGARVLLPRADIAPPDLADGLAALGADVQSVVAYCTVPAEGLAAEARRVLAAGSVDIACFTSSSTVRNLVDALDGEVSLLAPLLVACIGPVTAATARELGLRVDVVAREHTVAGLVAALCEAASAQG